jgi:C4-dicarboxylate-binding protein DctP
MRRNILSPVALVAALFLLPLVQSGAEAGEKIKIRFSTQDNDHRKDQPAKAAIALFFEELEAQIGDRVEFDMYFGGALGQTSEAVFGGMQNGAYELGNINQSLFSEYSNAFMPLDIPYLITSPAAAEKILASDIAKRMNDKAAEETGVRVLAPVCMGFRHVSNNLRPIRTPDDMRGIKIRVMPNPLHIAGFAALGAAATPVAFSELFTALQQKTVDAQENPIINVIDKKFYEVQSYFTYTYHLVGLTSISMAEEYYQRLDPEIRKAFDEAGLRLQAKSFEFVNAEAENQEELLTKHIAINHMTPEELKRFQDVVLADTRVYEDIIGSEYFNEIVGGIRNMQ